MKWVPWAILGAVVVGALLRLPGLDLRAMHTDEAVHAVKFAKLLETGEYRYDSNEYHGPTLNYFTLPLAWLSGQRVLQDLTEQTLRLVPALFGIGLILLMFPLRSAGPMAAAASAILTALSSALSFYSRYYIQETLLVFFAAALIVFAYRFLHSGRMAWILAAGVCGGLMFATKETWIISAGAMGLSLVPVLLLRRREGADPLPVKPRAVVAGVAAAVAVAVLFYSSFFSHWEGVRDSLLAYQYYFARAGEESRHGHPWHYFLRMLLWWQEGGPLWTQAGIVVFAFLGIAASFFVERRKEGITKDLRIFLAVYATLMLFIASVIPYKTPWLMLGALQPLILMAGWGMAVFMGWLPARLKIPGMVLLLAVGGHLGWQSYVADFRLYDDPVNPLVYSQPTDDVKKVAAIVEDAVRAGGDVSVQVIVSGDEYWPLPWYLRRLPQVGYWHAVEDDLVPTPVMLVSPDLEDDLIARVYEAGIPGEGHLFAAMFDRPMYLRPGKEIRGYAALDLWSRVRRGG